MHKNIDQLMSLMNPNVDRQFVSDVMDYVDALNNYVMDMLEKGNSKLPLPFMAGYSDNTFRRQILLCSHLIYAIGKPNEDSAVDTILTSVIVGGNCFFDFSVWKDGLDWNRAKKIHYEWIGYDGN